jgi:hypothetical protein
LQQLLHAVQQLGQLSQQVVPQQPAGQQKGVPQPSVQQEMLLEAAAAVNGLECPATDIDAREINADIANLYMKQILWNH